MSGGQHVEQVLGGAGAAAGDDGDFDGIADGGGHLDVVARGGAVGVHDVKDDFAGAEGLGLLDPIYDADAGVDAAAVDEDFPGFGAVIFDAIGVEAQNGGAAAEFAGNLGDQLGPFDGGGI